MEMDFFLFWILKGKSNRKNEWEKWIFSILEGNFEREKCIFSNSNYKRNFIFLYSQVLTCEEYAKDWKIEFNASKSDSMLFEKKTLYKV
ncbi:hypothetical protein BpHYR1_032897 [Brachionus plicatilis]|uniref:Uncharacterized protein n=1 Tax=Brachionus plicatilis TaxID=10195 RepID=A0A3M7QLN3_BRAPC|nr:hypothetical protein BpHYR1_032897 [Brachionus plicatilis]